MIGAKKRVAKASFLSVFRPGVKGEFSRFEVQLDNGAVRDFAVRESETMAQVQPDRDRRMCAIGDNAPPVSALEPSLHRRDSFRNAGVVPNGLLPTAKTKRPA